MSQSNASNSKGYVATAALAEGVGVKLGTPANGITPVVVATAATDYVIGVTENACAAGETASIKLRSATGTYKLKAGGTIALNDKVTVNGSGVFIATTTSGNEIVGRAVETAASGDFFEAVVTNDRV